MKTIQVYDPALCCSSGACGPSPDPQLAAFASALQALKGQAKVERFNLAQEPAAFAGHPTIKAILERDGPDALPVVLLDGQIVMQRVYPTRAQLEQLLAAPAPQTVGAANETDENESCCGGSGCC
ncbi:MAG: arsenite efflux transporter metallochaperone ArsD [Opitutales bacterium]